MYRMALNLATEYLRANNQTLREYDEDGLCGELANVVQMATPGSQIVSVSGIGVFDTTAWTYHTAVMLDGVVHDAWQRDKRALPLKEWLSRFDCDWPIELHVDGEEVFTGLVSEFVGLNVAGSSPALVAAAG